MQDEKTALELFRQLTEEQRKTILSALSSMTSGR